MIAQWRHSVAPREALVVLYPAMRSESHRRIQVVFEFAGKLSVFFFIVNYTHKQYSNHFKANLLF